MQRAPIPPQGFYLTTMALGMLLASGTVNKANQSFPIKGKEANSKRYYFGEPEIVYLHQVQMYVVIGFG